MGTPTFTGDQMQVLEFAAKYPCPHLVDRITAYRMLRQADMSGLSEMVTAGLLRRTSNPDAIQITHAGAVLVEQSARTLMLPADRLRTFLRETFPWTRDH